MRVARPSVGETEQAYTSSHSSSNIKEKAVNLILGLIFYEQVFAILETMRCNVDVPIYFGATFDPLFEPHFCTYFSQSQVFWVIE